jgi:hypothetical protein
MAGRFVLAVTLSGLFAAADWMARPPRVSTQLLTNINGGKRAVHDYVYRIRGISGHRYL